MENISLDQKLYYQGKELVDGHQIIEYNIRRNDIIQLMIKPKIEEESSVLESSCDKRKKQANIEHENVDKENLIPTECKYYKIGDPVDYRMKAEQGWEGAWFESTILGIYKDSELEDNEDNRIFICKVHRYDYMVPFEAKFHDIRPRSHHFYEFSELQEGSKVLANVNMDDPKKRGLWYDVVLKKISKKEVQGEVFLSSDLPGIECTLYFVNELMRIEEPILLTKRENELPTPPFRKYPVDCTSCNDNKRRDCRQCGCHTCGKKDRPELLLLCDECNMGFHINCLDPPLEKIPDDDEWFCPGCKNDKGDIIKAGETLKNNSKRAKMPSAKQTSGRDWDNGMACMGRTKECTIVPKNHFGPVPGVDVGTLWKFRAQASEAGIHRPLVAGIHGRSDEGAYSIVVSGGYEDDVDNGDEFEYTGAGGRDLSGNKRVNGQTCNQELTNTNKALALNCKAKFNNVTGAESENWREGKPVRVVRKAGKSKYAPDDGYRYDGIYKIVKYYPEKGKSGFIVWKYLLRRDDPTPAPWTKGAPVFDIIYPPEYFEVEAAKKKKREAKAIENKKGKSPKAEKGKKGKKEETTTQNGQKRRQPSLFELQGITKKPKLENKFTLNSECDEWIKTDVVNEQHWKDCIKELDEGKKAFLDKITETFMCICCQELVNAPITLPCKHNVCKDCLRRSFNAEIYSCPNCRNELGKNYQMEMNCALYNVLKFLFPGYEKGR
ncbi:hypothetical protein HHI36_011096 [Cryptolaemus montrouzieri]|uniref:RING-type E3 ubiquitin transferase n=1 Tax=Cryptolaemus montrouzieri TaxID=559131 RepID=A0ABD2MKQ5_9CUCU